MEPAVEKETSIRVDVVSITQRAQQANFMHNFPNNSFLESGFARRGDSTDAQSGSQLLITTNEGTHRYGKRKSTGTTSNVPTEGSPVRKYLKVLLAVLKQEH